MGERLDMDQYEDAMIHAPVDPTAPVDPPAPPFYIQFRAQLRIIPAVALIGCIFFSPTAIERTLSDLHAPTQPTKWKERNPSSLTKVSLLRDYIQLNELRILSKDPGLKGNIGLLNSPEAASTYLFELNPEARLLDPKGIIVTPKAGPSKKRRASRPPEGSSIGTMGSPEVVQIKVVAPTGGAAAVTSEDFLRRLNQSSLDQNLPPSPVERQTQRDVLINAFADLGKKNRVLLWGLSGTGKSTLALQAISSLREGYLAVGWFGAGGGVAGALRGLWSCLSDDFDELPSDLVGKINTKLATRSLARKILLVFDDVPSTDAMALQSTFLTPLFLFLF